MKIRIARPTDLEAVVAIYNQAVMTATTADLDPVTVEGRRDWYSAHDPERHPILVAEEGGTVVGWAGLSAYRPGRRALRHTAEISYYVHGDHHRKGVASALVRTSIDRCPGLDIRALFAILLEDNVASIRLLEKFGFERWGFLPRVADFAGREVGQLYYGLRLR